MRPKNVEEAEKMLIEANKRYVALKSKPGPAREEAIKQITELHDWLCAHGRRIQD